MHDFKTRWLSFPIISKNPHRKKLFSVHPLIEFYEGGSESKFCHFFHTNICRSVQSVWRNHCCKARWPAMQRIIAQLCYTSALFWKWSPENAAFNAAGCSSGGTEAVGMFISICSIDVVSELRPSYCHGTRVSNFVPLAWATSKVLLYLR